MVTMTVRVRGVGLAKLIAYCAVPVLRVIAIASPPLARWLGNGVCRLLTRIILSQVRFTTP